MKRSPEESVPESHRSVFDVVVQPRLPLGANLGVDNSGASEERGDGRLRTTAGVTLRGFGAETWNVGGTRRHFFDGHAAVENSRNASLRMPLGFWDFEWRQGESRYEKLIQSAFGSYASEGSSTDQNFKVGRTLTRYICIDAFTFLGRKVSGWHDTWSGTLVVRDGVERGRRRKRRRRR